MTDQDKTALLSKLRAPVADEPITNEMIQAGAKAAREYFEENGGNSPVVIYKAMRAVALASAPVAAEAVAWMHAEDPARVISALQKATSERDGGAYASSLRPYTIPLGRLAAPQASEDTSNAADVDELRRRVLSEISTFAGMVPEPDEDWDVWYCAAFDMLGSNVRKIFSDALDSSAAPQASEAVRDAGIAASEDVVRDPVAERDTGKDRLSFHIWALVHGMDITPNDSCGYVSPLTQRAWMRWNPPERAALSAQPGAQKGGSDAN